MSAIPGVESASLSSGSPFDGASGNGLLRIPGVASNNQSSLFFWRRPAFFKPRACGSCRAVISRRGISNQARLRWRW